MIGDDMTASLRQIIRQELARKSFAAVSPWMSLEETAEYLGFDRRTIYELRQQRRRAKTEEDREKAFAPEYGNRKAVRFHRAEVDAWIRSRKE